MFHYSDRFKQNFAYRMGLNLSSPKLILVGLFRSDRTSRKFWLQKVDFFSRIFEVHYFEDMLYLKLYKLGIFI